MWRRSTRTQSLCFWDLANKHDAARNPSRRRDDNPDVKTWIIAATLTVAIGAVTKASGEPTKTGARAKLDLEVSPRTQGGGYTATLSLSNVGDVPLWINGRMATGPTVPTYMNEVRFDVLGPGPSFQTYLCSFAKVPSLTRHDYVVLQPGKRHETKNALGCFDFAQPGDYAILAWYADRNDAVPTAPAPAVHLREWLISNVVHVQVGR
jgi:hypothetical protein